jgi:hypothetical protein
MITLPGCIQTVSDNTSRLYVEGDTVTTPPGYIQKVI